jgi:hypothetical protein
VPLGGLRALVVGLTLATLKVYNEASQHFESNIVALTGHMAEDLVHSSSIMRTAAAVSPSMPPSLGIKARGYFLFTGSPKLLGKLVPSAGSEGSSNV